MLYSKEYVARPSVAAVSGTVRLEIPKDPILPASRNRAKVPKTSSSGVTPSQ